MNTLHVAAYSIYLVVVLTLTVVVSKVLFSNGINYMKSIFGDREHLAIATNNLFQMGFFLLSFGVGLWYLPIYKNIESKRILIEELSAKTGFFTLFLGVLLFFNVFLFFRGMKAKSRNVSKLNVSK
jgi:hypothetical protein